MSKKQSNPLPSKGQIKPPPPPAPPQKKGICPKCGGTVLMAKGEINADVI
ncbi:MAG: hypothetical protein HY739_13020 [Desulfobacterales bacterium]|nr:hypothetical protein [Desulfobacterales bacterium]